ncbi:hypothetical protein OQA88_13418 [Cercophora sp. LCS_1]
MGGGARSVTGKGAKRPAGTPGRLFACPYWKRNALQYMSCLLYQHLTTTSFVVQHLRRVACHKQPIYCPRCGLTFSDGTSRQNHIAAEPRCDNRVFEPYSGLDPDQTRRLDARPAVRNEVQRWYAIWDALFPDDPRPATPYVDTNLAVELIALFSRMLQSGAFWTSTHPVEAPLVAGLADHRIVLPQSVLTGIASSISSRLHWPIGPMVDPGTQHQLHLTGGYANAAVPSSESQSVPEPPVGDWQGVIPETDPTHPAVTGEPDLAFPAPTYYPPAANETQLVYFPYNDLHYVPGEDGSPGIGQFNGSSSQHSGGPHDLGTLDSDLRFLVDSDVDEENEGPGG